MAQVRADTGDTSAARATGSSLASARLRRHARAVVAAYAGFGALWIASSDAVLAFLVDDAAMLARLEATKGLAFVAVTTALLALLFRRLVVDEERALRALARAARERGEREKEHIEHQALAALVESERVFSSELVESLPGIFYLYDEKGRFLRWNRAFERATGYAGDEIARMHPLDFFDDDERPLLEDRIGRVFERGESSVDAHLRKKDGTTTPYFFTGRRLVVDGQTCLVGVGVDVTELQHARSALTKSEERHRATLDAVLEGCQILDHDWRYLYLNEAAARHNRRPNDELLGRTMQEAWPGIEASHAYGLLERTMRERVACHDETEFQFPDGTSGWFHLRTLPTQEGLTVFSIDVTERREAERSLRSLNDELELKVARRTADLDAARARAEDADRLKSSFLATMSHELRTPLNSIIGFTGILVQGLAGPLNDEQGRQLAMVEGSARHLLDLINDVLDISRIEAGQLEVRRARFDLAPSITKVAETLRPTARARGLTLSVDGPASLPLFSDKRRAEQIVLNLVSNAVKFTDTGSVAISFDVVDDWAAPGDRVCTAARVRVVDTGIGISASDLGRLFEPFRQLDNGLERQREGTGLGLAISMRLAKLLGGTLSASSEPGRGSTFTAWLPLDDEAVS